MLYEASTSIYWKVIVEKNFGQKTDISKPNIISNTEIYLLSFQISIPLSYFILVPFRSANYQYPHRYWYFAERNVTKYDHCLSSHFRHLILYQCHYNKLFGEILTKILYYNGILITIGIYGDKNVVVENKQCNLIRLIRKKPKLKKIVDQHLLFFLIPLPLRYPISGSVSFRSVPQTTNSRWN